MKKFLLPVVVLALLSFTVSDMKLTKSERKMAATEMKNSCDLLLKAVKGLSNEQLNFKSTTDSWSVAECVEHIAISETLIFDMLKKTMETPAEPSKSAEGRVSDEQLLAMITDRTNKVKTQEPFEPTGKYGTYEATLKEFKAKRAAHIKYVKSTDDDLRHHYKEMPFGTIDGLQILLFMSGHTERHVKQIEEIKAHANFPAK